MAAKSSKFYVTTPIYYVNARPHIGHVYTTMLADVVARYHRLCGDEVFFLTGTDEHGGKVAKAAAAENKTPQQYTDLIAGEFQQTFARLGITNNDFIRTTQSRHESRVSEHIQQMLDSDDIYLGQYEGWYDEGQEEYVTETNARAQDYKSAVSARPLTRVTEKNYFFRLKKYEQRLLEYIQANPEFIQPEARRNEVLSRIRDGLNDVAVSRSTERWGIPMPGESGHSIYVWIDALLNYLTAVEANDREDLWPANLHLVGKEILWFHAVIWPAMLMAMGKPLYLHLYAHSHWISEGQKMSKSLGNFIDLEKLDEYVKQFGLDALRYYLITQGPLSAHDADFAHDKFIDVYNADLANKLGNCAARVTNMIVRYFEGKLPRPAHADTLANELREAAAGYFDRLDDAYDEVALVTGVGVSMELISRVDNYIELTQPFKLAKDESQREHLGTILYHCAEALRIASLGLAAVMPDKIQQLWLMLGVHYDLAHGNLADWCEWGQLTPGSPVSKGVLFPRFQEK
jgi:methionyl-tRNA synthetase